LTRDVIGTILGVGALGAVESDGDGCSSLSGGRPESLAAIFMPGFCPEHAPMAGRLRIQDPQGEEAGSVSGRISNAPAARDAVESLSGGAFQRKPESIDMVSLNTTSASDVTTPSVISVESLTPVAYRGKPVITTEVLAAVYGTAATNIRTNHAANTDRFIEDKHFFKVVGDDLRVLKDKGSFADLVEKRARHLILWTERGAARHAKMLDTDQAWDVFEKLEDAYFRPRESAQGTSTSRPIPDLTQCPPGTGAMVTQGGIVYFDATKTDVMDGESALVVPTRSMRPQVPLIAPVRTLRGQGGTAETGYAHLSSGEGQGNTWDVPVPCRILGRFLLENPRPKAPRCPTSLRET